MISGVSVILFNNVLCLLLHYIPLVFQFSGRQRPEKLHRYSDSHLTLKAKLYIYSSQKRFLSHIVQKKGGVGPCPRDAKSGRYRRYISAIFLAAANFCAILAILGHFGAILAILGHFGAILGNFCNFC